MKVFSINADNKVLVSSSDQPVPEEAAAERFQSREGLAKLTQNWPIVRLVAMWNDLPGVRTIRRFEDRNTAVRRIWKVVEGFGGSVAKPAPRAASRGRGRVNGASKAKPRATRRHGSKTERVLDLLAAAVGGNAAPGGSHPLYRMSWWRSIRS